MVLLPPHPGRCLTLMVQSLELLKAALGTFSEGSGCIDRLAPTSLACVNTAPIKGPCGVLSTCDSRVDV